MWRPIEKDPSLNKAPTQSGLSARSVHGRFTSSHPPAHGSDIRNRIASNPRGFSLGKICLGVVFSLLFCAAASVARPFPVNTFAAVTAQQESENLPPADELPPATTPEEARARAQLLHETIQGALQVMHRDFFNDEDVGVLPSQSLEDVFVELSSEFNVRLRWLTVDGDELSVHHRPQSEFERDAVAKIAGGARQSSAVIDGRLEYVGRIRLANQCLKCHVRQRLNLDDRSAGLGISIPIASPR